MTNRTANQPIIIPPTSTLLFSSNFAGAISLNPLSSSQVLVGTDNETGQLFPINNGTNQGAMGLLLVSITRNQPDSTAAEIAANRDGYGYAAIQDITGPDSATEKALYLELRDAGFIKTGSNRAWGGQMHITFQRITNGTNVAALADLDDVYCSYYFKRPAALAASMAVGDRVVQWDYKTGGYNNLFGGSLRLVGYLQKAADGNLYSFIRADRDANANPPIAPDGISPFPYVAGSPGATYWEEYNTTTAVPLDVWNKIEIYIHKHNSRGICLVAYNGVIVCAHVGRTRSEYADLYDEDWGRMYPFLIYSGNTLVTPGLTSGSMCRLRFRDYPPDDSVLQMPAANLLYRYAA